MKKTVAILLTLALMLLFALPAFAAGVDDGVVSVAEVNGKKFFGTALSPEIDKYVAADGYGATFYDLNGDKAMNVCDLVALHKNEVDFNLDKTFDGADTKALRLAVLDQNF